MESFWLMEDDGKDEMFGSNFLFLFFYFVWNCFFPRSICIIAFLICYSFLRLLFCCYSLNSLYVPWFFSVAIISRPFQRKLFFAVLTQQLSRYIIRSDVVEDDLVYQLVSCICSCSIWYHDDIRFVSFPLFCCLYCS